MQHLRALLARVGQHLLNHSSHSELSQTLGREEAQQLQNLLYSDVLVPARDTQPDSILFANYLLNATALVQARQLFVCLAVEHYVLPVSARLIGIKYDSLETFREGGQARILRGEWRGRNVAAKVLRCFKLSPAGQVEKREFREIATWLQLSHPFILPLLGVDTVGVTGHAAMISPWCEYGNIEEYLSNGRRANQRLRLLTEVAQALEYLHCQSIVHEDLHPKNILIDEHGHVRLSDYGLSGVVDASVPNSVTGGLAEYSAPEKITSDSAMGHSSQSMAGDIFAFGCVSVQVYSSRSPYYPLKSSLRIVLIVVEGKRPTRPSADECHGTPIPDRLWTLLQRCWQHEPSARPSSAEVVEEMIAIVRDEGAAHHITTPTTPTSALCPTPATPVTAERPKLVAQPSPRPCLRIPGLYLPLPRNLRRTPMNSPTERSPICRLQSPIPRVGTAYDSATATPAAESPTLRNHQRRIQLLDQLVDENHSREQNAMSVLRHRRSFVIVDDL